MARCGKLFAIWEELKILADNDDEAEIDVEIVDISDSESSRESNREQRLDEVTVKIEPIEISDGNSSSCQNTDSSPLVNDEHTINESDNIKEKESILKPEVHIKTEVESETSDDIIILTERSSNLDETCSSTSKTESESGGTILPDNPVSSSSIRRLLFQSTSASNQTISVGDAMIVNHLDKNAVTKNVSCVLSASLAKDHICQHILSTLPTLSAKTLSDLIALLEELGVELYSDLKLVEERDLVELLKPIQRRKLLKTWKETTFVDVTANQINKFGSNPVLAIPIEPATTQFEKPAYHKNETARNMIPTAVERATCKSIETSINLVNGSETANLTEYAVQNMPRSLSLDKPIVKVRNTSAILQNQSQSFFSLVSPDKLSSKSNRPLFFNQNEKIHLNTLDKPASPFKQSLFYLVAAGTAPAAEISTMKNPNFSDSTVNHADKLTSSCINGNQIDMVISDITINRTDESTLDLFVNHTNESSSPALNQTNKPTSNHVSSHNINLLITDQTNNDSSKLFKQTQSAAFAVIADHTESGMETSSNQIASISSSINDDDEKMCNIEGLTESSSLLVDGDRSAWAGDFEVPWQLLPADLLELLERGEQLVPHDRRLLIQVICSCIKKVCIKPTKKDLDTIAKKMVSEYPYSLSDNTMGTGFRSISNQMLNRITNTNRKFWKKAQTRLIVRDFSRGPGEIITPNMKMTTRSNTPMIEMLPRSNTLKMKTRCKNNFPKIETPPTKKYCADQGRGRTKILRKMIEITKEDKQCNNWAETFVIPWHELPRHLQDNLETGERPIQSDRLLLIREICQFIQGFCRNPGLMPNLKIIAKKMVYKYPDSLCDIIGGKVVGNGYTSILNQLVCRIENLKRGTVKRNLRKELGNKEHSKMNIQKKHSDYVQHSDKNISTKAKILPKVEYRTGLYKCVEWAPPLPENETVRSQRQKQEDMKAMFTIGYRNLDSKIIEMLRDTYSSQRLFINKGSTIQELVKEWPWLFTEGGFLGHFKFLVGVDIVMKFHEATLSSVSQIVNYMKLSNIGCADKLRMKAVLQEVCEWSDYEEKSCNFAAAIFLLMAYFGEDSSALFLKVDKAATSREVELMDELPKTPCLVICGKETCSGDSFMLAVDKVVVNKDITTFEVGVAMVFASYYCLNISYPIGAGATLEFIQKCFLSIHPNKGTKVSLGYKSKSRVFSLISRLQAL